MAVTGLVDVAEATKWTGDPDVDPAAGELTVTPANAAVARVMVAITIRSAFFTMRTPSELGCLFLRSRGYECIYSGCIRRVLNYIGFAS
jgi:hypothetical protein